MARQRLSSPRWQTAHSPQPIQGCDQHAVADLDALGVGPDRDHLADILVAERHRQLHAAVVQAQLLAAAEIEIAVGQMQIAVADAGGQHLQQHLGARRLRRRRLVAAAAAGRRRRPGTYAWTVLPSACCWLFACRQRTKLGAHMVTTLHCSSPSKEHRIAAIFAQPADKCLRPTIPLSRRRDDILRALGYAECAMTSLALEHDTRAPRPTSARPSELIDSARASSPTSKASPRRHAGDERELRTAVAQRLKAALHAGRARPRSCCSRTATAGAAPSGSARCRTRSSASCSNSPRKHLYPSQNPSEAERMAVVATGGYGRGLHGAGLRHRSAVPAALQADRLGRVGRRSDPLLPVGHGPEGRPRHALGRRMHPPGQGGHDHPHRAPRSALPARRHASCSTS